MVGTYRNNPRLRDDVDYVVDFDVSTQAYMNISVAHMQDQDET